MGVPTFFRWLREKYGRTIVPVKEETPKQVQGVSVPVDWSRPNPNGIEFDNLYLDMNGIIHPCVHPEGRPAPKTEGEMFTAIAAYIERLMAVVRPRKVLYMAIDGVAPRAKMNQQRSRRFKTAKEMLEHANLADKLRLQLAARGMKVPAAKEKSGTFDHNVITPGTPFMHRLSLFLRYWISEQLANNSMWRDLTVVFSDAKAPGEGEHKLMAFVREQRAQPGYNPNTRHILHGLDADLIMLGLATHEAHFTILREEVLTPREKKQKEAWMAKHKVIRDGDNSADGTPLQFLHISILREYLAIEFEALHGSLRFPWDIERLIDDFVFLCFFVGNDFLPHLPSLDIREGALDLLLGIYKIILPTLDGYLTSQGTINLQRANVLLARVGAADDEIFRRRRDSDRRAEAGRKRFEAEKASAPMSAEQLQIAADVAAIVPHAPAPPQPPVAAAAPAPEQPAEVDNRAAAAQAKAALREAMGAGQKRRRDVAEAAEEVNLDSGDSDGNGDDGDNDDDNDVSVVAGTTADAADETGPSAEERKLFEETLKRVTKAAALHENVEDEVRLGEAGWKDRYYISKFKAQGRSLASRRKIARAYVEGLQWVLAYYYIGVPSWDWYYPYHYAPFASDLTNVTEFAIGWKPSKPFRPLEQLMAVLPPFSAHALPPALGKLMTSAASELKDMYPDDFPEDPNGKRFAWQWVALLPFIDEQRLLSKIAELEHTFTEDEKDRNQLGTDTAYVHESREFAHALRPLVADVVSGEAPTQSTTTTTRNGISDTGDDIAATFEPSEAFTKPLHCEIQPPPGCHLEVITSNPVIAVSMLPPEPRPHLCCLLPGAQLPAPVLDAGDSVIPIPRLSRGFNVAYLVPQNQPRRGANLGAQVQRNAPSLASMGQAMGGARGPRSRAPGQYPRHTGPSYGQPQGPGRYGPPQPRGPVMGGYPAMPSVGGYSALSAGPFAGMPRGLPRPPAGLPPPPPGAAAAPAGLGAWGQAMGGHPSAHAGFPRAPAPAVGGYGALAPPQQPAMPHGGPAPTPGQPPRPFSFNAPSPANANAPGAPRPSGPDRTSTGGFDFSSIYGGGYT